jgi:predicted deacylase
MPDPATKLSWLDVARTASGAPLRVAVHTLEGAHDGPTVGLTAGIHGDEIVPIEVIRQVLAAIDPQRLHGRIVAVPLANPPAFESFTRHTPTDMHNLNRVFPGTADSWISELLARALVERLVPKIDLLIDLHSGGAIPTVDYVYVLNAPELSRAFLFPTLYRGSSYPGSFGTHVIEARDVPVVVAEIGGGGQLDANYLARGVAGVLNVLRRAGALEGEVVPAPSQLLLHELRIVRPRHGGIHTPVVGAERLGETVPKGTVLGQVRDPQTFELLETFEAPFDPTHLVLVRGSLNRVHPGDYGYMLGNAASAERLAAEG